MENNDYLFNPNCQLVRESHFAKLKLSAARSKLPSIHRFSQSKRTENDCGRMEAKFRYIHLRAPARGPVPKPTSLPFFH
jgi:hypothetical protein